MPNHITNKVVIIGTPERITEVVALLVSKNKESRNSTSFDFDNILPMPAELHGTTAPSRSPNPELIKKYGSDNWYDWSCANWGTKWNSYCSSEAQLNKNGTRATFVFQTAWSTPAPVIAKLSEKFPDIKIKVWFADEDFGYNVGKYICEKGEIIEEISLDNTSSGRNLARKLYGLC